MFKKNIETNELFKKSGIIFKLDLFFPFFFGLVPFV